MPLNRHQQAEPDGEDLLYVPPPGAAVAQALRRATAMPTQRRDTVAPQQPALEQENEDEDEEDEEWDEEDEKQDETHATRPRVRRRGRPRSAGLTRGQQIFVEVGGLLTFGVTPYGLDMACTVMGLTRTLLPASLLGLSIAAGYHIFTSLGQRYFLVQRGPIRVAGALLLAVNTITNLYGIIPALDRMLGPTFLGVIPRDPGVWPAAVAVAAWAWLISALGVLLGITPSSEPTWPSWLAGAAVLTVVCAMVAWWSEILLDYFLRRVQVVRKG